MASGGEWFYPPVARFFREKYRNSICIWFLYLSAWNKYFASTGQRVRQSALRAGHSQFEPVFCIWYTIEIWKPVGHCDRQKTDTAGHTWNRAVQWPMTGYYFMHCTLLLKFYWLTFTLLPRICTYIRNSLFL